ncbi:MAG: hypothetical protein R2822_20375 [Spirosomataceae bacterium]
MRFFLLFLPFHFTCLAQNNVHIQGQFEGFPSSNYRIQIQNQEVLQPVFTIQKAEETIKSNKTDENGCFQTDIRLDVAQKVTIECLGYHLDFLLSPNDTLIFRNPSRLTSPVVSGSTACLHKVLYESKLFGRDSLREKPLFQHISYENYALIINDLAEEAWLQYQHCDTTNARINTFIKASLEGQRYLRKQVFLENQGNKSESKNQLKMLTDDAWWVDTYQNALFMSITETHIHNLRNGRLVPLDSLYWGQSYQRISEALHQTPRTRELLLARIVQRSLMTLVISQAGEQKNVNQPLSLFERFQQDFPQSVHLPVLQQDREQRFLFMQNRQKPAK